MGRQIIRQPDGLYAVFSTGVDSWIAHDLTRDGLIEWFAERAARDARRDMAQLLDDMDEPGYANPMGETFEEANAASVEHGGTDLGGKLAAREGGGT